MRKSKKKARLINYINTKVEIDMLNDEWEAFKNFVLSEIFGINPSCFVNRTHKFLNAVFEEENLSYVVVSWTYKDSFGKEQPYWKVFENDWESYYKK